MPTPIAAHYRHLAKSYDDSWADRSEYVRWMSGHIAKQLRHRRGRKVMDIGSGTGLFLRRLADLSSPDAPIVCVDPSAEMLARIPDEWPVRPVCASAEAVAARQVALPYGSYDGILLKEVIHHIPDPRATVRGLTRLLAPQGRMLIVTLPPKLEYPLFQAALARFAAGQPSLDDIQTMMRTAGLGEVRCEMKSFETTVDLTAFARLVSNKWMSVLSSFTQDELDAGIAEMQAKYPKTVSLVDRFAFISGVRR